jgi:hypothetical protein
LKQTLSHQPEIDRNLYLHQQLLQLLVERELGQELEKLLQPERELEKLWQLEELLLLPEELLELLEPELA